MADTFTSYYDLVLRVSEQGTASFTASQKAMRDAVAGGEDAWRTAAGTATSASTKIVGATTAAGKSTDALAKATQEAAAAQKEAMAALARAWDDTAAVALSADEKIAKSTADAAAAVDKATATEIAALRAVGKSYQDIAEMAVSGNALRVKSAQDSAAAIELAAGREAEAIRSRGAKEAEQLGVRARAAGAVRSGASDVGRFAGNVVGSVGTLAGGAIGLAGYGLYRGIKQADEITASARQIGGLTGLPAQQAAGLSILAKAQNIAPSAIGLAFGTLGTQATKALDGSKSSVENFQKLGLSAATVRGDKNNLPQLFDAVYKAAATKPEAERADLLKTFLGRGARIGGQLESAGPIATQVKENAKGLPDPKLMAKLHEESVKLQESITKVELAMVAAFGPTLIKLLQVLTPALAPLGKLLADGIGKGIKLVGDLIKGPVGKALGEFGTAAVNAGKGLIEAFKPAMPFLQNVLLPLLKGVAEGVGIAIIGSLKLAAPVVKVLAEAFGELGKLLEPLKGVFEDVGKVIGVVFAGNIVDVVSDVGTAVEHLPLLGKVLSPIGDIVSGVGGIFKTVFGAMSTAVRTAVGVIASIGPELLHVIEAPFTEALKFVEGLPGVFGHLGEAIIKGIVEGVEKAGNLLGKAFESLLENLPGGGLVKEGIEAVFGSTGGHAAHLTGHTQGTEPRHSSGHKRLAGGGYVPGSPHEDGTLAWLSGDEFVMTGPGQAMMDANAPGLLDHIAANQAPHFAAGGWTIKSTAKAKKPPKVKEYLGPSGEVLHETSEQHSHRALLERKAKLEGKTTGLSFAGPVSTFGPPGEPAGTTAYGGSSSQAGLALNPHGGGNWNDSLAQSLAGKLFRVEVGGHTGTFKVIDKGPSTIGPHGPRVGDITGAAAKLMGLDPMHFPTDSAGRFTEVIGGVAGATTSASTAAPKPWQLSGLAYPPEEAFYTGFEAGISGDARKTREILKAALAASKTAQRAVEATTGSTSTTGGGGTASTTMKAATGSGGFVPVGQTYSLRRKDQGRDIQTIPGGVLLAPGSGRVLNVASDPSGFGPDYPIVSFSGGPYTGKDVYYGHTDAVLKSGATFGAGAIVARTSRTGHNAPPGWAEIGFAPGGSPGRWGQPTPFRRGGPVSGAVRKRQAAHADIRAIGTAPDETQIRQRLVSLSSDVNDVRNFSLDGLEHFAQEIRNTAAKARTHKATPIQLRRLETALDVVEGALGDRLGREVRSIELAAAAIAAGQSGKGGLIPGHGAPLGYRVQQERAGIASGSSRALGEDVAFDKGALPQYEGLAAQLRAAQKRAEAQGSSQAAKAIEAQLSKLQETITEMTTDLIVKQREMVVAAAQEGTARNQQQQTLASGKIAILGAEQVKAGTTGSAAALREQSRALLSGVLPSEREVLGSLRREEGIFKQQAGAGNTAAAQNLLHVQEQIQQQQLAILNTQNEAAQKLMEAATAQVAAAQSRVSLANAQYSGLQLEEELHGVAGAPSSVTNAEFIKTHIEPAQKEVIAAAEVKKREDEANHASEKQLQEDQLQLQEANNTLLQEQVDVSKAIQQNTVKMVDGAGTTGFSFQGQSFTDLVNVGVGA